MGAGVHTSLKRLVGFRYRAKGFSYLPKQPVHSVLAGRKRSRLRGRGLDFDELRHYRPGDDIRSMDWRVTRRMRSPFVRVYTEEKDRPVWLIVDQRISMFFGSQRQMKSVAAAEAAALTAWRVIAAGDRVGALLFNDSQQSYTRPSRATDSLMRWLNQMVSMNQVLGSTLASTSTTAGLEEALNTLQRHISHGGLVIIISDFEGWDERCLTRLKDIRQRNDVVAAVVTDPLEHSVESAHKLIVSDGYYQLAVDTESGETQRRYRQAFQQRLTDLTDNLKRHAIPLIPITTANDVATQLQRTLGGHRQDRHDAAE